MRRFRWVASLLIFAAALLVYLAFASNRRDTVTLPSGLTVQWLGITEGTNAYVDGHLIQKLLGDRIPAKGINLGFTTLTRPKSFQPFHDTDHVAWFRLSGKDPSPPSYEPLGNFRRWRGFQIFFRNQSGRELEVPHPMPYTMSKTNALFAIPMVAYPRDEPKVTLRIGTPLDDKTEQQWAEFELTTPARVKQLPAWNLQSLPATNYVGGFPVVLRSASASSSTLDLILPSANWTVPEMTIFDQEGNRYSLSQPSDPALPKADRAISFPASFGADRPWHARMKIVHARGFVQNGPDNLPQVYFPADICRRISLSAGGSPALIANNNGEVFSCVLHGYQLEIRGSSTERPYWAVVSAWEGAEKIEVGGSGWVNPSYKDPSGFQFFQLRRKATKLTVELACPQVIATEFYFQPAE